MSETEAVESEPSDEIAGEHLVAEVAALDEDLAGSVATLLDRVETLESELESTESKLETVTERLDRTRRDFKNYKERSKRQQEDIRSRATEDLVGRLLEVRDNLDRALDDESDDVDSIREGVDLTRKQFDRVFAEENVERIEPELGSEVDPARHEVMMEVESDHPPGTIASVYRPGYEMAGRVLRSAQVTVAKAAPEAQSGPAADEPDTNDLKPDEPEESEGDESVSSADESIRADDDQNGSGAGA